MPPSIPSTIFPVFESALLMGRELTYATAPSAFTSIPLRAVTSSPKLGWLEDDAFRGSNVDVYGLVQSLIYAELTIPPSPAYGDTLGGPLFGLFGDYTTTGTAASPNSTLNGGVGAGVTSITVTSGTGFAANQWVQVDVGSLAEIVQILSVSSNTLTLVSTTPTRFSHLTGVAITNTTANYTHTFSNLNPASGTGNTSAQPPTYTFLHRNLLPGSGSPGFNADQYLYGHITDLTLDAKADQFVLWDGKVTALSRSNPASNITPSFSAVTAWPAWKSSITLNAGATYTGQQLKVMLNRKMDIVGTLDGIQSPYVIAAGALSATFSLDYDAVSDETALNYALNNTQPTLAYSISNGLSSPNTVSMTLSAQLMGHKTADLSAQRTLWGYRTTGRLVANTTNAGNSGGYSPCQVVLVNAVPSY